MVIFIRQPFRKHAHLEHKSICTDKRLYSTYVSPMINPFTNKWDTVLCIQLKMEI